MATGPGNLALPPASIATALAMTAMGARGETAAEMRRVLHLSERSADLARLGRALRPLESTPGGAIEMAAANRVSNPR